MTALVTMPKYATYKESGEDWLGMIPDDWSLLPVKQIFRLVVEPAEKNNNHVLLSIYTDIGVKPRAELEEKGNKASTTDGYWLVKKGDFIVNKLLAWMGAVGLSEYEGVTSPAYDILRKKKEVNGKFFHYLFRSSICISELKKHSKGIMDMRLRLYFDKFGAIKIPFPSVKYQNLIVDFLDQKTAQIDAAIAIKEQQIALLKECKQILIQQAVTQGLDPTVPMKDSGVEWIGEIPAHWKYTKIKYCIDILPGYAFKSEEYTHNESDIKLLRGINVNPGQIKWDDVVYWSTDKLCGLDKYKIQLGDLVIGMDRPWVSTGIRVAQIQKDDLPSLLLQRVARIRGKNGVLTNYVKQLLSTKLFVSYFEPLLTGISVPHISTDQIEDFECPIPTPSEQEKILAYINDESKKIAAAVILQQQQIEKLREYKTTLINSAVTGKIRVTPEMVAVSA